MKKRLLSLLLALCMVLTLLPAPAMAAEETTRTAAPVAETAEETVQETVQAAADAPSGMEHLLTDGKLEGSLKRQPLYADKDNGYYTDVADAIAQLRSKMVSRTRAISIPLRVSKADVPGEEEMEALILGIFALATAHTGVPTEGDYLLWSIADLKYGGTYSETDTYYYLNIAFEFKYYTSSNDERNFASDAAAVISRFGFTDETDDYTKILSIYAFICDTVAYDYENLDNENYTGMFTAETALRKGKAVCQGYSLLLYYMLLSVGIDCRLIAG